MCIKSDKVVRLYPTPAEEVELNGLYLGHVLHNSAEMSGPVVYSNYILSFEQVRQHVDRSVYVLTDNEVSEFRLQQAKLAGVKVLQAGSGELVGGREMVETLVREGFRSMYTIAVQNCWRR